MSWFNRREDKYLELIAGMQQLVLKQTEVAEAQAKALTAFLDGFKVDGPPEARVFTELDEWQAEQERMAGDPLIQQFPSPNWAIQSNQD